MYKTDQQLRQDEKYRVDMEEAEEDIFGSEPDTPSLSDDEYLRMLSEEMYFETSKRF